MAHLELLIPWRGSTKRRAVLLFKAVRLVFRPIPKSDERFARRYRCGPPRVSSAARFGHSSPSLGRRVCSHSNPSGRSRSVGGAPRGIPPIGFLTPYGFTRPLTSHTCRTRLVRVSRRVEWEPQASVRARRCEARRRRAPYHNRGGGVRGRIESGLWPPPIHAGPRPSRSADRLVAVPHPAGAHRRPHPLPSRQFHALLNSLFKVLFNFPLRYLSTIGLVPVFSLRWSLPPALGCIPKQPDFVKRLRGAAGRAQRGSHPLWRPFRGTWARSALRALLQTTIRTAGPPDSKAGLFGSLAVTKGILVSFFSSAY
ncbi:hypothetical protein H5410_063991 [Solanum commersonii]|uniref:Uncharacterized protein n=1 Tax=Solanum commersonii TaxID=4109 RepID=A0A9J5W0E0_SOLCO|nr:hypothetical protein H5410_063991 [Solanum commersonii]